MSLVVAVARDVAGQADLLNRLDGLAGDGDLGVTATHAAAALEAVAVDAAAMEPAAALRRLGRAIASGAPSTGGTLIAFAFMAAGAADLPEAEPGARIVAALDGRPAVHRRARAGRPGRPDDARRAVARGGGVPDRPQRGRARSPAAAARAAEAAEAGAQATTTMEPTVGRAGWLKDRARGNEDPGARLVAIAVAAAAGGSRSAAGPPAVWAAARRLARRWPGAPPRRCVRPCPERHGRSPGRSGTGRRGARDPAPCWSGHDRALGRAQPSGGTQTRSGPIEVKPCRSAASRSAPRS